MNFPRIVTALVAGFAIMGAVPASAQTVTCKMAPGRHGAYIAPQIKITLRGPNEGSVSDAIITSTGRKTVVAEVDSSRPGKLRIVWVVPEVKKDPLESRPGPVKLSMRLSITLSGGAARLEAQDLLNRKYSYQATGRCTFRG